MRLFVAIDLPSAEKAVIGRALERLAAHDLPIRWLPADSLHITLKFLGETSESQCASITSGLRDVAAANTRFDISLQGLGAFPTLGRPDIFWLGVEPSGPLATLQQQVEAVCTPLGFAPEARAFKPHITIGKTKARQRIRNRAAVTRMAADFDYQAVVPVRALQLMQSWPGPHGARYETLATMELN